MNFYQVKLMVPLSYTVKAEDMKHADKHARQLAHGKAQIGDLAPFVHSITKLKEGTPDGEPTKAG